MPVNGSKGEFPAQTEAINCSLSLARARSLSLSPLSPLSLSSLSFSLSAPSQVTYFPKLLKADTYFLI